MNDIYSIVLSDGTEINGLTMNGTNFVSETPISADIIKGNCSPLKIVKGEEEEVIANAELACCYGASDGWHIAFRELSKEEVFMAKVRADLDYIAMMTDTDLEEG